MPVYNSEKTLEKSIFSVINQTYKNWELYIINDNSNDKSLEIIKEKFDDNRIKLINSDKKIGPAAARNLGIRSCNGEYLSFLDSDDTWENIFLEKIYNFAERNNYLFCCASYKVYDLDIKIYKKSFIVPECISYNDLLKKNSISCLTAFINIKTLGKTYMQDIVNEDYYLWIETIKKVNFAYGLKDILATRTLSQNSLSSKKIKIILGRWKIYRNYESIGIFYSFYLMINYIINSIIKFYL